MSTVASTVPSVREQAERLIELGVHDLAGLSADQLLAVPETANALLAIHPDRVPASALVPLVRIDGRQAFVVSDMTDVDEFTPIPSASPPAAPMYLVRDLDRGDAMTNWSPDEALPAIAAAGRTPLTLTEGLHWLL